MVRWFLVVVALAGIAQARSERRYVVHPTSGSFADTPTPCGPETRAQIDEVVGAIPTLEVEGDRMSILRKGSPPITSRETRTPTADSIETVFRFGETKRLTISLSVTTAAGATTAWKKGSAIWRADLVLSRQLDTLKCYEHWQGEAQVSR